MYYPDKIPYLKTIQKTVSLPCGEPIGKGNLIFLYSKSLVNSINMINVKNTFSGNGRYHLYFINGNYTGTINHKTYRYKNLTERLNFYSQINKATGLKGYTQGLVISPNEDRNMYFDLFQYLNLFDQYTLKVSASIKISEFWSFITPILNIEYGNYSHKYVLVNANDFKGFSHGSLNQKIKNPLYLMYYTLLKKDKMRLIAESTNEVFTEATDYFSEAVHKLSEVFSSLDIDFLFYCNGRVLKINPSKCDDKSANVFLTQINKLYSVSTNAEEEKKNSAELDTEIENDIPTSIQATEIQKNPMNTPSTLSEKLTSKIVPKAKDDNKSKISNKLAEKIANKIASKIEDKLTLQNSVSKKIENIEKAVEKEIPDATEKEKKENVIDAVNKDEAIVNEVYTKTIADKKPQHSERSTARDKMLKEKQKDIVVKGSTVSEVLKMKANDVQIEKNDISSVMKTTNPNMKEISFNNFNKTYNEKVLNKDILNCFTCLNDKSIKLYIRDVKVQDTSDVTNYKETWTVSLEDENRQRHTIKVDIPKWIDDKFLWLGGNRKIIKNQDFLLPVVKIAKDTVLIVSNYNKITIQRIDTKSLRNISVLDKLLEKSDKFKEYFTVGNSFFENHNYLTTLEYDDLSKKFKSFSMNKIKLYFNQKEALEIATRKGIKLKKSDIFIGMNGTEPIILDMNTQRDSHDMGIVDIIFDNLDDELKAIRSKINIPKRLMFTQITMMEQDIPMSVILSLWEGLTTVLKKAEVKYRLVDNIKDIKVSEDYVKFANCYLIYDSTIPNELLLNSLKVLDTVKYDISAFDTREPYLPYIEKKFGRLTALNTLFNAYEFTIGAIEKELLTDMKCPTDIVSLCIYANNLLCDNDYTDELNMSHSRIRCAEVIPAILYDKIAKSYTSFKNSNGKNKLSIPQNAVIKDLMALKTVEDYSSLNPLLELEETHGVSTKGFRGINLEKSYSIPKRAYDTTMTGIIAPTSSPDGNVGVNRSLTMEPNITSVRGYPIIKDNDLKSVKDVNLFSPAELLIPLGVTTDDAVRTGHSVKQSRHMVPITKSAPVLISNGSDELCKYYLSSDFVVNAKMDGKVIEKDLNTNLMIVEYKDGTHQAIDIGKKIVKNGGGGFELSNQLTTNLEIGKTFKKNETIAWHKDFFSTNQLQGTRLNIGPLTKIAICGTYNTYEDCTFVTDQLSQDCTTEMCFKTPVVIGRHSNVSQIVNLNDTIKAGDPLIQFDDSFEDGDINKLLQTLGDDEGLKDAVVSNNRNIIKSKFSGTIESIKMYSTADLEELSPTLKTIFKKYYHKINSRNNLLEKYNDDKTSKTIKCGILIDEPTGKVEPDRYGNIRGQKVNDGVLIEFEIKHAEPLEVGSKIANFTALKNVVGEVLPKGMEPYSDFRKDEEIGTFIPPISILARMTPSILLNALGNKCIVELKRSLKTIWDKPGTITVKRRAMCELVYKFFTAFDKSGTNTNTYKELFTPMSDAKFQSFFKQFFNDDMQYLILNIVDYERTITMDDIERAAKVINVPLYEYVYIPHISGDKEHPIVTKEKVAVGYINIKRTQQTIAKKNGLSTEIDKRSAITNQVVRSDKNGRESDLENIMLTSNGLKYTLKELNGPRADDMVMKQEMMQEIATKGYTKLANLDDKIENKTTLNTVDTYFLGMSLNTDLVTRGLKTINTLKKE